MPMQKIFGVDGPPPPANFPPRTTDDEKSIVLYLAEEYAQRTTYNGVSCHSVAYCAFRTVNGFMGLCQRHIMPGDVVAVLLGGSIPFVLREFRDHHVLLGDW